MKKFLTLFSVLLAGIVIGGSLMGFLSMKASRVYLEIFRIKCETEQELLAARARRDGAIHWEVAHRKTAADISLPVNLRSFEDISAVWGFAFPFAAPILEAIGNIPEHDRAYRGIKGVKLAKLADALERLGKPDEAALTWKEAAELIGHNDVERAKSLVEKLYETENAWLISTETSARPVDQ